MYPKSVEKLIESFKRLPGVGDRSAERYAYKVIESFSEDDINQFISSLLNIKNLEKCPRCGFIMEGECVYCSDHSRRQDQILVVEESKSAIAIEKAGSYRGLFHVLGGVLSPINGIGIDELNIKSLFDRITPEVKEVIIATSFTPEGEATASYLSKVLSKMGVLVSRIAYGMPSGSSLEYSDSLTIEKALEHRNKII